MVISAVSAAGAIAAAVMTHLAARDANEAKREATAAQTNAKLAELVDAESARQAERREAIESAARKRAYRRLVVWLANPNKSSEVPPSVTSDVILYASDEAAQLWIDFGHDAHAGTLRDPEQVKQRMATILAAIRRDEGRPHSKLTADDILQLWGPRKDDTGGDESPDDDGKLD